MNKRGISLSVGLLVLSCFVLVGLSLAYFVTKQSEVTQVVYSADAVEQVYVKQGLLDFYIQDIFNQAVLNFNFEEGDSVFIYRFKQVLAATKEGNGAYPIPELVLLEEVSVSNILLSEQEIVLSLDLAVKSSSEEMDVEYRYQKDFGKVFK